MSTYTPSKIQIETNLDSEGIRLGFPRLKNESMEDYSFRLKAEILDRSNGKNANIRGTLSRSVGLSSKVVAIIDVVRDENGEPVAPCPAIEILSGKIYLYSDYLNDEKVIQMLTRSEGEANFVQELVDIINGSSEFTAEIIDISLAWESVHKLRTGTSIKNKTIIAAKAQEILDLGAENIVMLKARNTLLLTDLVEAAEDVDAAGKYYIDSKNGILVTYEGVIGEVEVDYSSFPFNLIYDPVTTFETFDESMDYVLKEEKPNEEDEEVGYRLLTPMGNKIHRTLLQKVGNQWS